MMLQQGVPGLLGNSGDGAAAAHQARESGGGGSGSGELGGGGGGSISGGFSEEERGRMEEGERNSGGNRWPRQETLALLKIRSDMDVAFRDSSLKGPLWDEVSRKLAELGYHRSSKKCKEKFENVYKYHKRTKEGRTSKADGKTYRFFDQLEALDTHPTTTAPLQLPQPPQPQPISSVPPVSPMPISSAPIVSQVSTVPSINPMATVSQSNVIAPTSINPTSIVMPTPVPPPVVSQSQPMATNHHQSGHFLHPNMSGGMLSNSTSSSTSSDSEPPERRRKRKRKWKDFFGRLMKEVIDKQEELQMKFLSTLEKRERERMMREEAWRVQEMAKMNHEHDLLVQERSIAAAKDAAVISFLQKITEQQNAQNPNGAAPQLPIQIQIQENQPPPPVTPVPIPAPAPAPAPVVQQQQVQQQQKLTPPQGPQPQSQPQPQPQQQQQPPQPLAVVPVPMPATTPLPSMKNMIVAKTDNGGGENNMLSPSPSRWPKAEVQALIKLRTTLDMKYQENGPKGPLWEEISSSMRKLGYNRNAKRCKEKWENINKYYKKVKESSKKRPEDSKTCPYFHQLDAIYREKAKSDGPFNPGFTIKPENQMAPIMARPEQQWPLPQDQQEQQQRRIESGMDIDENLDQNHEDDDDEDDEDEDEDEGAGYEIVTNKASSMATIE